MSIHLYGYILFYYYIVVLWALMLSCGYCVQITVNDIETTYTLADGLSDLFPRRSTDGEDNNTVALGQNEKYLDKGVDGEGIDVSHRAALELARRGELVVDVPPQFCLSGPVLYTAYCLPDILLCYALLCSDIPSPYLLT